MRISRDELYISMAFLFAKRATCDRLNVGCVIVKDKRPITGGYNGPLIKMAHCTEARCDLTQACERAVHAEANAIAWAAKAGVSLAGATLYCTDCPCLKCAELIIQSGIIEVVFARNYRQSSGKNLMKATGLTVREFEYDRVDENTGLALTIASHENKI